ncbi:hypothetical protein F53441_8676 [Fusarium austroafricanum]|uniref:FAR1 domain-containing protein n=1 Tax=Fusarium austroafricanum TaxID=2364996 RepID=A0A8H4KEK5_9HYPO|nr:hypothetical protein F53441_8676 [Fusarium austroafricanum]
MRSRWLGWTRKVSELLHAYCKKKSNADDPRKVIYRCSKGRKFNSQARSSTHASRRRKTSTQMTGCPFRLAAVRRDDGPWVVRPVEGVNRDQHNHESLDPAAYSKYRKYGIMKLRADIINAWNTGTRPHQILPQLRADPNSDVNNITRHDLNNLLRQRRREELADRTLIQWLFGQLEGSDECIYREKRDDQNRLLNLLIVPRDSVANNQSSSISALKLD